MVSATSTSPISWRRCVVAEVIVCSATYYYSVALPEALGADQTANLVLETVRTHATYPFPPEAAQNDRQAVKHDADLFVLSPYKTLVQRTKFTCVENRYLVYTLLMVL